MKWKNWKQNARRAVALMLGAVLVMTNMGSVSHAEGNDSAENVIGYSDALVEKKDLSQVTSYTVYREMTDKTSVTEIKIGTAEELLAFSEDFRDKKFHTAVEAYEGTTIYLDNDIKINDVNDVPMLPIGYYNNIDSYQTFQGTFDGQGHEVDVMIDDPDRNGVGFIGAMGKGTVKNLIFSGSVSGGKNRVGGIVGFISGGPVTIKNCYNKANVTSTHSTGTYVGGIVGFINGGTGHTISNCTNEGSVIAIQNIGGIAGGINTSTTILKCRNIGEVKAADWGISASQVEYGCGGIVGILKKQPTSINDCINDGTVRSWGCTAAGIAGNVQIAGCTLSNVYNYGTVTNSATDAEEGFANPIYGSSTGISGLLENEINSVNSTAPTAEDSTITDAALNADTSIVSVTKDIVGYSDARVVGKDLTNVISMTDYLALTDKTGVTEIKITSADELVAFSTNNTGQGGYSGLTIYLANDIDVTDKGFASIGNKTSNAFKGIFDGQGYEVSGINITSTEGVGQGFFGHVSGATIKNLIVSGNIKSGFNQVGGIVGDVYAGTVSIDNCYNKIDIEFSSSTSQYAGGIVGMITNDSTNKTLNLSITNCTNAGNITAGGNVGGIVGGSNYTNSVSNCRNIGTITAANGSASGQGCGAIAGVIKNKPTTITGCINNGTITKGSCATAADKSYGCTTSNGTATVTGMTDYSSGETEDTSYDVAVNYADTLLGDNAGSNRKENASITEDIVGYSDARVEYVELSAVMDFTTYKELEDKSDITKVKICTGNELKAFRTYFSDIVTAFNPELTIYLANDIDMTDISMAPIGTQSIIFTGTFDGQGYEISNFTISADSRYRALFGYVSNATIKNVILSGSISGGAQAGGIVSHVEDGNVTVDNCYNKASVTSSATYAGGIAALVRNAAGVSLTVSNCTNTGAIEATGNVGGLVGGALYTTSITNSRNTGTVTATAGTTANGCGGLVGIVKNQSATISGAINNGAVAAGACTGAGIIGAIEKVKGCSISTTTNYGTVTAGDTGKAYAVYGMNTGTYAIEDSYALYDKTGETDAYMAGAIAEGKKHTGWILGDANGDTEVDVRDVVRIKRHVAGQEVEINNTSCADTNRDNAVTDEDAGACRIVSLEQIFYAKGLEGLTVNAIGDSYFAGAGLPQDQVWIHMLANKYGMDMNNYGIGGSTVSYTTDSVGGYHDPMTERYTDLIDANNNPDIILVEGGRNDFNYQAAIGDISLDNADKTTYVGALNLIIDGVEQAYPNAMIVCVTPWNFPDKDGFTLTYEDYCNAMVKVAELQGVKCIKAYDPEISGVDMRAEGFSEAYTVDNGVSHLNLEGMKIVMPRFEKLIAEYWEEFNNGNE